MAKRKPKTITAPKPAPKAAGAEATGAYQDGGTGGAVSHLTDEETAQVAAFKYDPLVVEYVDDLTEALGAAPKQTSPAVSSAAAHAMREPIDQALWNRLRNDEQAFYAFARERKSFAACCLVQDESKGQK